MEWAVIVFAGFAAGLVASWWARCCCDFGETPPPPGQQVGSAATRLCRCFLLQSPFAAVCPRCRSTRAGRPILSALLFGGLLGLLGWLMRDFAVHRIDEVVPATEDRLLRFPFYAAFLFFLFAVTLTDLIDYIVPDQMVGLGILFCVGSAFLSGDLQTVHIMADWSVAVEGFRGPWLPEWLSTHQHLHGLAWSVAGAACGAVNIAAVRFLSGAILGQPAMGMGDVTLAALIGAGLGWQPMLCVVALSPIAGILIGPVVRVASGRNYVAYGPYLTGAAVIVLCSWRWIWQEWELRLIFSHLPTIGGLIVGAWLGLAVLLLGLRIYRSIPARR